MHAKHKFDVVIVGYGPVGATLANLLGQRGLDVAVLESARDVYDKPRAITADHEAMRVFQECGLADEIARATIPHPGTDYRGLRGQVIKRFYPQAPPHPLGWEPAFMFVQPDMEATLRRGVQRFSNVQVLLGHALTDFEEQLDQVVAHAHCTDDGKAVELPCRYLIACDGGKSLVRRQLASPIEDLAFDEWWMIIDAHIKGPVDLPPRAVQYCRPTRPGTYMVGPGTLRRWEIKLLPGESAEDFQSEEAVRRVWGSFIDVDAFALWRTAIYRFHALVVEQWSTERVFLMGDAAHQMPPFLGQGLCAGIRDASNLAWKLEGVLRGRFNDHVLPSYGLERKPHVRTIVSHAKSFGLIIGELDPVAALARDERLEAELHSGRAETVRQKFIPGLTCGLIDSDANGQPTAGAGALFPQPWVRGADGAFHRLDDRLGTGFLIATDIEDVHDWLDADARAVWSRIGGQMLRISPSAAADTGSVPGFSERDGVFCAWLAAQGQRVALVRPDHYVHGMASDAAGLSELVRRLGHTLLANRQTPPTQPESRAMHP